MKLREYLFIFIAILCGLAYFKMNNSSKILTKENESLKKEILAKDTLIKISDGEYSKLVNTFTKEKELKTLLEKENAKLKDTINARNERILSFSTAYITLKNKSGSITPIQIKSDSTYTFVSYYPREENYFIKYSGDINFNNKSIIENWSFEKFKLNIVLTERQDGLWDYYLDGPEYMVVSDLKINSLPSTMYTPKNDKIKLINTYAGLGYSTDLSNGKNVYIQGGVGLKNKFILLGELNSNKSIGVGLLFKL